MKLNKETNCFENNFSEEIINSIDSIISKHLMMNITNNEFLKTIEELLKIRDYYKKELKIK